MSEKCSADRPRRKRDPEHREPEQNAGLTGHRKKHARKHERGAEAENIEVVPLRGCAYETRKPTSVGEERREPAALRHLPFSRVPGPPAGSNEPS